MNAAATPWTARAAISCAVLPARPHAAEARAKIATPNRKTRRRPKRSPSEPPHQQQGRQEESVGLDHPLHLGHRGAEIRLQGRQRPRFTAVPSMKAMLEPRMVAASTQRSIPGRHGAAPLHGLGHPFVARRF